MESFCKKNFLITRDIQLLAKLYNLVFQVFLKKICNSMLKLKAEDLEHN